LIQEYILPSCSYSTHSRSVSSSFLAYTRLFFFSYKDWSPAVKIWQFAGIFATDLFSNLTAPKNDFFIVSTVAGIKKQDKRIIKKD
jgi:hypothetical protein